MAYKNFVLVCAGAGCEAGKGHEIHDALVREAEAATV